jgi:signal transduction histidine kinase
MSTTRSKSAKTSRGRTTAEPPLTRIKALQRQLKDYRTQVRRLAIELTVAEERQRHRIAADLHDEVGLNLTMAKMRLDTAWMAAAPSREDLAEARRHLDAAARSMRDAIFGLNPLGSDRLELGPALTRLVEALRKEHPGLRFELVRSRPSSVVAEEMAIVLFRAARELLMNVVKHAEATRVRVAEGTRGGQVSLRVEDNGTGFRPTKVLSPRASHRSFGLLSIRERLAALGGTMKIESAPGQGTRVTLLAPICSEVRPAP